WIVKKHLIHNERQPMFTAEGLKLFALLQLCEMASRIIRMPPRDRARPWRDALTHSLQIQMPAMVIEECIRDQADIIQCGKKIEERVAWLCDQHLIARIT